MEKFDRKKHWETIYATKKTEDVSWFQPKPETSLQFFRQFDCPFASKIIDVGGGDSYLVDNLLEMGYTDITVLDISELAIEKAKKRLGAKAGFVKWIIADAANFAPSETYDFWHDRAAFHFLTNEQEINQYIQTVSKYLNPSGIFIIGTFSEQGPKKCSGIEIRQYSEPVLTSLLQQNFEKITCITENHETPSKTYQSFIFCSFRKIQ